MLVNSLEHMAKQVFGDFGLSPNFVQRIGTQDPQAVLTYMDKVAALLHEQGRDFDELPEVFTELTPGASANLTRGFYDATIVHLRASVGKTQSEIDREAKKNLLHVNKRR